MRTARRARDLFSALAVTCVVGLFCSAVSAHADETVLACGTFANGTGAFPNGIFYESDGFGMEETQNCGEIGGVMQIYASSTSMDGTRAYFATDAPSGLLIDEASVTSMGVAELNQPGSPFGGGFFWGPSASDGVPVANPTSSVGPFGVAQGTAGFPSNDFGFQIVCVASSCGNNGASLDVSGVQLSVAETQGPSLSVGGLANETGWVYGTWPITANGDSASGVCSLSAALGGVPATATANFGDDQAAWHQCDAIGEGGLSGTLDTALADNGADSLFISDTDAAGLSATETPAIRIDNVTPMEVISGPASAISTGVTQYEDETVVAGDSGAYGANCSVDNGPIIFYPGATGNVPVTGVGPHEIDCTGESNAISADGQHESSSDESRSIDILAPTTSAITFASIADHLRCHTKTEIEKVLRREVQMRRGKRVVVNTVHRVKHHVRECHARTVRRRVLVVLKRHGRPVRRHGHVVHVQRIERVELLPHQVEKRVRILRHGQRTTVSGQLLLPGGIALSGQTVAVLGAANDAAQTFREVSSAVTNADGVWVAKIPAGPSRLLEAVYGGTPTAAASTSTTVRTIVPSKVRILSATGEVAWGQTVTFSGRVYGGFIPHGGLNLRLRYGYGGRSTTYGVKTHVGPRGRFRTTFTFGPGDPHDRLRFHFQFATLPGGNYPFHAAVSNTVVVRVGGHPGSSGRARPSRHRRRRGHHPHPREHRR